VCSARSAGSSPVCLFGFVLSRFANGQLPDTTPLPLYTTGVASLLLGLYSFALPHTPPPGAGRPVSIRSIIGIDALRELGSKPFYVFIACSLLICIPLAAYYAYAPIFAKVGVYDAGTSNVVTTVFPNPSSLMTLGQISETGFMLLMAADVHSTRGEEDVARRDGRLGAALRALCGGRAQRRVLAHRHRHSAARRLL